MLLRRSFELTLTAAFALVLAGCTDGNSEFTEVSHDESEVAHDDHSGHGHGHHGPNGGDIVEVGNEEFHAEVVVDEDEHRIDVFILGSDAKTAKPIAASEIAISFKHGDEVEEFKLSASALDGESEGQASKFSVTDEELFEELHEHSEGATLTFADGDQTLTGTVKHSHGHDHGHSHAGDEDGHHDHGDDEHGDEDDGDHKHGDDGDEHGDNPEPASSQESKDSDADVTAEADSKDDTPAETTADDASEKE